LPRDGTNEHLPRIFFPPFFILGAFPSGDQAGTHDLDIKLSLLIDQPPGCRSNLCAEANEFAFTTYAPVLEGYRANELN
jgi:hypothetical protein